MTDKRNIRPLKEEDQENTERALSLIQDIYKKHPEIEESLWAGALWSALVCGYINSGFSYKQFIIESTGALKHYKGWFDDR